MANGVEVELKLTADGRDVLGALARMDALGSARLEPPSETDERDTYLDTPDGRLAAARWACRLRERDGRRRISLKGPAEAPTGDGLHRRPEVEGDVGDPSAPWTWPPSPARELVRAMASSAHLVERLTLLQRRTERAVTDRRGVIGLLSLDVVDVQRAGAGVGRLYAVELELAGAVEASRLEPVAAALQALPGLRLEPRSKLELALAMLGDDGRSA